MQMENEDLASQLAAAVDAEEIAQDLLYQAQVREVLGDCAQYTTTNAEGA